MFIVRYVVAAIVLVLAVIGWGAAHDMGVWQIAGRALAVVLALQGAILVLVAVLASRPTAPQGASAPTARKRPPAYLAILPR